MENDFSWLLYPLCFADLYDRIISKMPDLRTLSTLHSERLSTTTLPTADFSADDWSESQISSPCSLNDGTMAVGSPNMAAMSPNMATMSPNMAAMSPNMATGSPCELSSTSQGEGSGEQFYQLPSLMPLPQINSVFHTDIKQEPLSPTHTNPMGTGTWEQSPSAHDRQSQRFTMQKWVSASILLASHLKLWSD